MNRRDVLKSAGILGLGVTLPGNVFTEPTAQPEKPVLTLAHITDVHLPEANDQIAERFKQCLKTIINKHQIDFFLNTGDSIMDASYDDVLREKVLQQWSAWDECLKTIHSYKIYSCLGNHDMWWAAPSTEDEMYGKSYGVKRLKIPARYYSFSQKGWCFIVLDGNNKDVSLDDEQYRWLETTLNNLPTKTPVLVMSHYPVFGATPVLEKGNHSDNIRLKDLFYKHRDKVKIMLGGHNHLFDQTLYNGVLYCCNGAMSGFWWGKGDDHSAAPFYYQETPPGYAIIKLYADGRVQNEYFSHLVQLFVTKKKGAG